MLKPPWGIPGYKCPCPAGRLASSTHFRYYFFMKLKRLNWNQRNYDALNQFLAGVRPDEIAVFDWDNTCIFNDIGEALLRRLTFDLAFRIDAETMAAMIPDRINGVDRVRLKGKPFSLKKMKKAVFLAYEKLKADPAPARKARINEDYRIFTSGLLALNRALEETPGIGCEYAYPWVNTLLQGLSPAELEAMAAGVIRRELEEPLRRHSLQDPLERWRYGWIAGIRIYPEMKALAQELADHGAMVVVSTASNRQLVEKMVDVTGFPCRRVIGMELTMENGRFGAELQAGLLPNLGRGKVANIRKQLGREPVLAAGDSENDAEMLSSFPTTRIRLIIQRPGGGKIAALARRALAGEPGYLLQGTDHRLGKFTV